VALGNVGDETALPFLEKAARDQEPLIAEHAHWAMGQIYQPQLLFKAPVVPFNELDELQAITKAKLQKK
jgi:HEAT repeat protein